jgi:cyclohexa-1,5-dienecarbonyl-CoA hydratase
MPGVLVRRHKNILWLIIDTPQLNLLTITMLEQLLAALREALKHPPQMVIVTGAGEQAFCAGVELPGDVETDRARLLKLAEETCQHFDALRTQHILTIALVKGIAYAAGCELAALCDVVIAREDARFRLPAVNARVFICATSTYLPASIGSQPTTQYMQSGETIDARTALRLGLAHQVLPSHLFLSDTEELLTMLASVKLLQ